MSSKGPSPPIKLNILPKPSKFTYKDLYQLNDKSRSYKSKLSVVGLIDLNAFFAQVEQIRLNLSVDDPIVFVQWQAVIAVSYAARKFGINRMDTIKTCKEKCPNVILAHAAVYEKGSSSWKYLDKLPEQSNCKVSLDPNRRESRKIFKILNSHCDLVQKSSVDEGYMDFGRPVYKKLLETFSFLGDKVDDNTQTLPPVPKEIPLEVQGVVFGNEKEVVIEDWDDIVMIIGSNLIYGIRKDIYDSLGYTTSGGISRNMKLAKLAGGFIKPDNQTILLNRDIPSFLKRFELIDINGMGGKMGEALLSYYQVPGDMNSIEYLMSLTPQELESCTLVENLYDIVWGNDSQELKQRNDAKSMMSRKQMTNKNPVSTLYDCLDWIKTFSGDLCNRLEDLDEETGQLFRPKTLSVNLHIKNNSNSRQCPIPVSPDLSKLKTNIETYSLKLVIELLNTMYDLNTLNNGKVNYNIHPFNKVIIPPIHNFAIIISSIGKLDNSIDGFAKGATTATNDKASDMFKKYEEERELERLLALELEAKKEEPPKKKNKLDKEFISSLFANYERSRSVEVVDPNKTSPTVDRTEPKRTRKETRKMDTKKPKYDIISSLKTRPYCSKCGEHIQNQQEHDDFHLALELSRTQK